MENNTHDFSVSTKGSTWHFVDVPAELKAFQTIIEDILPVAISQTAPDVIPEEQRVVFVPTIARNNIDHPVIFDCIGLTSKNRGTDIIIKKPDPSSGKRKSLHVTQIVMHEHFEKEYWHNNPNSKQLQIWEKNYYDSPHETYADEKSSSVMDKGLKAEKTDKGLAIDQKYFDL